MTSAQYTVQRWFGDWPTALGSFDFSESYCTSTEFIFQGQRVVFSKVGTKFLYITWMDFMHTQYSSWLHYCYRNHSNDYCY